jgi:SagB-type dehydrogenase family enzyme
MIRSIQYGMCAPGPDQDAVWELYHENSKLGRHTPQLALDLGARWTAALDESLCYGACEPVPLPPDVLRLEAPLGRTLTDRVSTRDLQPCRPSRLEISTLLHYSYGITRHKSAIGSPRSLRVVPSAGSLYPLELYLHVRDAADLAPGLYHYEAERHLLRCLRPGEATRDPAAFFAYGDIAARATLLVFLTAMSERVTVKYGDRGYRYVLLEAGHVAQNMNLVATAIGLGSVNLCGYFDREVDELLGIDGLAQSTVYVVALGGMPGVFGNDRSR